MKFKISLRTYWGLNYKGANLNPNRKRYGISPIHTAVKNENFELVKLLIEKGANVNGMDAFGAFTPLDHALNIGNNQICELLESKGALPNFYSGRYYRQKLSALENLVNESKNRTFTNPNDFSFGSQRVNRTLSHSSVTASAKKPSI